MTPKYRAWIRGAKEMLYKGYSISFDENTGHPYLTTRSRGVNNYYPHESSNFILMQTTGLKDMLDTEIYEADILLGCDNSRDYFKKVIVVWDRKKAAFRLLNAPIKQIDLEVLFTTQKLPEAWSVTEPRSFDLQKLHTLYRPVVIGNVFETPWLVSELPDKYTTNTTDTTSRGIEFIASQSSEQMA